MPGLTDYYSGRMILYALKFIQFVVRETSKSERFTISKRITISNLVSMKETASLLAASVEKNGGFCLICVTDRKEYDTSV